ncbi:hypothetical protein ABPG74_013170 [Tetrahymena malaccensis]
MNNEDKPKKGKGKEQSCGEKVTNIFFGNSKQSREIRHSQVYATFQSVIELINILLNHIVFNYTQNLQAILFFDILSVLIILSNMIPKLNVKYGYYRLTLFMYGMNFIVYIFGFAYYLIENFYFVINICNDISTYYKSIGQSSYPSQSICTSLNQYYYIWIGEVAFIFFLRVFGLYIYYKAFQNAFKKYQYEKTKKDRKKKFLFKAQEREEQKKRDIYYRDISKRKL